MTFWLSKMFRGRRRSHIREHLSNFTKLRSNLRPPLAISVLSVKVGSHLQHQLLQGDAALRHRRRGGGGDDGSGGGVSGGLLGDLGGGRSLRGGRSGGGGRSSGQGHRVWWEMRLEVITECTQRSFQGSCRRSCQRSQWNGESPTLDSFLRKD